MAGQSCLMRGIRQSVPISWICLHDVVAILVSRTSPGTFENTVVTHLRRAAPGPSHWHCHGSDLFLYHIQHRMGESYRTNVIAVSEVLFTHLYRYCGMHRTDNNSFDGPSTAPTVM